MVAQIRTEEWRRLDNATNASFQPVPAASPQVSIWHSWIGQGIANAVKV